MLLANLGAKLKINKKSTLFWKCQQKIYKKSIKAYQNINLSGCHQYFCQHWINKTSILFQQAMDETLICHDIFASKWIYFDNLLTYILLYLTTNFKYIIQKIRINKTLVSYKLIRFNFKGAVPIHRDMASRSEGFVKCFLICWVSLECSYLIYYASGFGCLRKRHPQTV